MKNKMSNRRPYSEIMDDVQKTPYGKGCRKLHKELKEGYKDGLPLFMRYPNVPTIISLIAVIFALFVLLATLWIMLGPLMK